VSDMSQEEDALLWFVTPWPQRYLSRTNSRAGERPVCRTCIQNKHECAGYGPDTDNHTVSLEAVKGEKEMKKTIRRESSAASNADLSPKKLKVEGATQPTSPPPPPFLHHRSAPSHEPASSANLRISRPGSGINSGLSLNTRNRMPYFRYFGPTAIMPGFKQMVVKVIGKQHNTGQTTSDGM
jgi:hypothetical protein